MTCCDPHSRFHLVGQNLFVVAAAYGYMMEVDICLYRGLCLGHVMEAENAHESLYALATISQLFNFFHII